MTPEPRWLEVNFVMAAHEQTIAIHGGSLGTPAMDRLLAAMERPRHRNHYGQPTVFELAAAYAFGIAKGHPFTDGNKRVAIILAVVFLRLNGWLFSADETETYSMTNGLAAGEVSEEAFAKWLEHVCVAAAFPSE